ncbi:MAG TPA: helix-turn-helix domain-containing protein [Microbacterium sp.]|nr:helix-turn-helix domain-containing protein [Microbacterium sp.]
MVVRIAEQHRARLVWADFGGTRIVSVAASSAPIAAPHGGFVFVLAAREATSVIGADGERTVPAQHFVVLRSGQYSVRTVGEASVLTVPASLVAADASFFDTASGHVWPADSGAGLLAARLLHGMAHEADTYQPREPSRLVRHLLGILWLACGENLHHLAASADPRQAILDRAKRHIEASLGDIELTPQRVAAAVAVSTRTLQRLFGTEDTTVSGYIRERRLARCRADLGDPALAHVPVGEIGSRWGLLDAAHFSRSFKASFGASPRAYRARVLAEQGVAKLSRAAKTAAANDKSAHSPFDTIDQDAALKMGA